MCSQFLKRTMENYQGDLTDILRASGSKTAAEAAAAAALAEWQFPGSTVNNTYPTDDDPVDVFGDPFSHLRDPLLLQSINTAPVSSSGLFLHSSEEVINSSGGLANSITDQDKVLGTDGMKIRPNNMFSRMLQIAPIAKLPLPPPPCDSPAAAAASPVAPMLVSNDHTLISPNSASKGNCLVESSGNLQISSPRNTGIRRRKSQAKKVICVPAPAPANSRSSGEIVPSDLWAWRKYGQKPIKGSPFPRGYYRCSSSKGCSARKQVERSRTDPNMLVITYTSEHNHPWPTQRNALAGSTRSQPKNTITTTNNASSSALNSQKSRNLKDQKDHKAAADMVNTEEETTVAAAAVKEEEMEEDHFDDDHMSRSHYFEFDDQGFSHHNSYRPTLPSDDHHSDDGFVFADLGEIESDSLDMLLTQGFSGDDDGGDMSKSLDPFTFYDWASSAGNNNTSTSNTTTSPTTAAGAAASDAGANKNDSSS